MWSLIIVACIATEDGAACHEVKWHGMERADCLHKRNEERAQLEDAGLIRLIARCERGLFG